MQLEGCGNPVVMQTLLLADACDVFGYLESPKSIIARCRAHNVFGDRCRFHLRRSVESQLDLDSERPDQSLTYVVHLGAHMMATSRAIGARGRTRQGADGGRRRPWRMCRVGRRSQTTGTPLSQQIGHHSHSGTIELGSEVSVLGSNHAFQFCGGNVDVTAELIRLDCNSAVTPPHDNAFTEAPARYVAL